MAQEAGWKRVVGGLCGIGITLAVLLMIRQGGISGADVQQWETAIVIGAGACGVALWVATRKHRRRP